MEFIMTQNLKKVNDPISKVKKEEWKESECDVVETRFLRRNTNSARLPTALKP